MSAVCDNSVTNASGIEGVSFEIWEYLGEGQRRFDRRKTVSEVLFDLNSSLRRYPKVKNSMLGCRLSLGDACGNDVFPRCNRISCSVVSGLATGQFVHIDAITEDGSFMSLYVARVPGDADASWELARTCAKLLRA